LGRGAHRWRRGRDGYFIKSLHGWRPKNTTDHCGLAVVITCCSSQAAAGRTSDTFVAPKEEADITRGANFVVLFYRFVVVHVALVLDNQLLLLLLPR
jgi:hypothetical protein